MTQQGRLEVAPDPPGDGFDPPLTLMSFEGRPPRAERRFNPLLVGIAAACTLALGAAAISGAFRGGTPNLTEAGDCLRNHDLACAEADYRAYVRKYPEDGSAAAVLAIVLTQQGKHQDALPYYVRAMRSVAPTYDLHANYAVSLNATGRVDDAIGQNYAALKLVPTLVDVRGALANQLVERGRGKEAVSNLEGFDRWLVDQGEEPYFAGQIAQIRGKLGMPLNPEPATHGDAPAAPGVSEVRLQASGGNLYAPAVVDGSLALKFVVDSGASDVCIPADVARTLTRMGKLTRSDARGSGTAVLADGSQVQAERVMIHSIQVGGHTVKNVLASVTDAEGSLLLGQSFLRRFKSWSIDNDRKVLILRE
jgi:clan AA aspartic protease (TIGR02281 family)